MTIRRKLLHLFLCLSLLTLSSCVTQYLWGDNHYQENIDQFLVGADGRYVALVGEKYHYVFSDNTSKLKELLALNQRGVLRINVKKTYLKLGRNNNIRGHLVISGPFSILPPEDKRTLVLLGIEPDKNDDVTIELELTGKRYLSRYLGHNATAQSNSSYSITIYYKEQSSVTKDVGKAAITPIAVTLDAVLLIGKVVVKTFALGE